ncbi:MarR family winged helix-turn-helix transcriptional regulator [Rhizobium anhuiense]|uniref:MarR family winged helix-turn-helix transcriptional regulator n=1 Tax=Rhizobium anhuiense TaxID=1184720 RepID=UPI001FEEEAE4|nr:hypothetical protein [Rhizobium anhuiense]
MVTVELSTLSRLVTVMKKKELVSRTRPDDGRTVSIALTPSGDALVRKLMPLAAEFEAVGVETFSEADGLAEIGAEDHPYQPGQAQSTLICR